MKCLINVEFFMKNCEKFLHFVQKLLTVFHKKITAYSIFFKIQNFSNK